MGQEISISSSLVTADGETPQDALRQVQTIIEEWIETAETLGREIPARKGQLLFA
jgi:predicted RNase H-like HicB family nuclease